jgi:protein-S-isoprenylcysteine O-methyltransferase Ste14
MNSMRFAWLILGVVIGGYWMRVWTMAHRARRRSGRAANFIPAERLGDGCASFGCRWWVFGSPAHLRSAARRPAWVLSPIRNHPAIAWVGCGLAACCFIATICCWKTMGRSWRMGIDPTERTELVSQGPYARLAHPIYALSQWMMLGTMLSLPSPLMLAAGALHLACCTGKPVAKSGICCGRMARPTGFIAPRSADLRRSFPCGHRSSDTSHLQ